MTDHQPDTTLQPDSGAIPEGPGEGERDWDGHTAQAGDGLPGHDSARSHHQAMAG